MSEQITALLDKMKSLELELEAEFAKRHAELRVGFERGKVAFEAEVRRRHAELRTSLGRYIVKARPLAALTAPVIYSLIVPFALLDLAVSIYQAICFPAYGIEKVRRRDYLIFDRHHLAYLNLLEKLNCAYCSYANGVIAYVREVGARTERHWCPIKHATKAISAHEHYRAFVDFGDAEGYRKQFEEASAKRSAPSL